MTTVNDGVVRLTFPAKSDYLLLARLALTGLARSFPLDAEVLADLKLAVTEACGNAVRHAYDEDEDEGPITVELVAAGDRLELVVEDEGAGVDAAAVPDFLAEDRPEGGMGMAIMRAVVDELDIRNGADGKGTVVHMTKFLRRTGNS
jgi:serine/threonine-protein kinase RsbW